MIIAGATATFTREVEAGPVALIGAGALFCFIGLAGALPIRFKLGSTEAEWAAGQTLAEVAALVPREKQAEAILSIEELAEVAPATAQPALRSILYETSGFNLLRDVVESINSGRGTSDQLVLRRPDRQGTVGADAFITIPGSSGLLAVEFRSSQHPLDRATVERLLKRWSALEQPGSTEQRVLLMSRTPFTPAAHIVLRKAGHVTPVTVRGPEDAEALRQAVERAVL